LLIYSNSVINSASHFHFCWWHSFDLFWSKNWSLYCL